MKIKDGIQLAFDALKRQRSRTVLTMIALGIGIASVVVIMAAGKGLEYMVMKQMEIYSSDSINIEVRIPGKGNTGSASSMALGVTITTFKNEDVEKIRKHPNVSAVYSYITSQEILKYRGENKTTMIFGYGADAVKVEKMDIENGRFYTVDEEDSASRVVVLGFKVKEELFGDDTAVGKNVSIKGKNFKVVGVLTERGSAFMFDMDSVIYIPTKTLQKRLLGTDYVMGLMAKVIDSEKLESTKEDFIYIMREQHDIVDEDKDDFEVMTMKEAIEMTATVLDGITLLLIALVCISLIVAGVGITNIMYVSVSERTFEIGLRKAVGAKSEDILYQFLFEAIMLTMAGGIFGVVLGVGVSYLVYQIAIIYSFDWVFSISIFSILLSLGFSTFIGLFFGVYPAKKAAGLDPITALRKE